MLDDEALNDILARRFVVFHCVPKLYYIMKMNFIAYVIHVSPLDNGKKKSRKISQFFTSM